MNHHLSSAPRRGRPATGRTTRVIRVPINFDEKLATKLFFEWLPIIEKYRSIADANPNSVRNEKLIKLLDQLHI